MHIVVADTNVADIPELATTGAAAAVHLGFPVTGVVANDFIVVEHDVRLATVSTVGLEAVLTVVLEAVVRGDVPGPQENAGTTVVDHGVVLHRPALPGVMVNGAFVHRRHEVPDRQVLDRDIAGVLGEGVLVLALSIENRTRSTDVDRVVARDDLVVLTRPK